MYITFCIAYSQNYKIYLSKKVQLTIPCRINTQRNILVLFPSAGRLSLDRQGIHSSRLRLHRLSLSSKCCNLFIHFQIYIATLPPPGGAILPIHPSRAPGSRTGPVLKRGDRMMASEPQGDYRYIDPQQG